MAHMKVSSIWVDEYAGLSIVIAEEKRPVETYIENEFELSLSSQEDFKHAYRKALRTTIFANLMGRRNKLPAFDEVERSFCMASRLYVGIRQVCVAQIAGSVDRNRDFDAQFNPVEIHTRARWESIDQAMAIGVTLPPVELYKLGDRYFVKDGNHRVSVAKHRRVDYIDAEVIEYLGKEDCPHCRLIADGG